MAVTEPSEDVSMEVEETPAPKSRRGRRGKTAQTEAVSVLETPLNVVSLVDIHVMTIGMNKY